LVNLKNKNGINSYKITYIVYNVKDYYIQQKKDFLEINKGKGLATQGDSK